MQQTIEDRSERMAIIGAGFAGLGLAAAMKRDNIPFDLLEADNEVGGNWYHGVYDSAHIISSKRTTQYSDYPMPDSYPDFPSAKQMHNYLKDYANHWQLRPNIGFNHRVEKVEPTDDDQWIVKVKDRTPRKYRGVVIANGHHWKRRMPNYPGEFAGEIIHSKDYKNPDILRDKRVLVVGGGNSACDVAVEAARFSKCSHISLRRGYWFMPKTIAGKPMVEFLKPGIPVFAQRIIIKSAIKVIFGDYEKYGLPKPDHKIFERHPTVNSQLLYHIKHGRILPFPDIERFEGNTVYFKDGRQGDYDLIVCATGYEVSLPMLPDNLIRWQNGFPQLIEGVFPPDHKNLYIFGLGQPRYGAGPLITEGAELLCSLMQAQQQLKNPVGKVLAKMGAKPPTTWLKDPIKSLRSMKRGKKIAPRLPLIERMVMR